MTVVEQLEALQKEHAAIMESHAKQAEALATIDAERKAAVDQAAQASKAGAEAVATEQAAHNATKAELDQLRKDLDAAKLALANPAHTAAAVAGSKDPVPEGGAEASRGRGMQELEAEYKALKDPVARAKWRAAHAEEVKQLR